MLEVASDALTTPECLALLQRLEAETRRLPVAAHRLINQLARHASDSELGGKLAQALANRRASHSGYVDPYLFPAAAW